MIPAHLLLLPCALVWSAVYSWRMRKQATLANAWLDLIAPGLTLIYLWLTANNTLFASLSSPSGDQLLLTQTQALLDGKWLGTYTPLTLTRGPLYPLFWAGVSEFSIPLTQAHGLLHAFAAWLLLAALRGQRGGLQLWAQLLLFCLFLLNPIALHAELFSRAWSQPLELTVSLLVFASCVGYFYATKRNSNVTLALWSGALGLFCACAWLCSPQALWLAVLLGLTLVLSLQRLLWTGKPFMRVVPALAPLLLAPLLIAVVALKNQQQYGYFGIYNKASLEQSASLAPEAPYSPEAGQEAGSPPLVTSAPTRQASLLPTWDGDQMLPRLPASGKHAVSLLFAFRPELSTPTSMGSEADLARLSQLAHQALPLSATQTSAEVNATVRHRFLKACVLAYHYGFKWLALGALLLSLVPFLKEVLQRNISDPSWALLLGCTLVASNLFVGIAWDLAAWAPLSIISLAPSAWLSLLPLATVIAAIGKQVLEVPANPTQILTKEILESLNEGAPPAFVPPGGVPSKKTDEPLKLSLRNKP